MTQTHTYNENVINQPMQPMNMPTSSFDGGLFSLLGYAFIGALISVLSLGILYPLARCLIFSWEINHTIIDGKRLRFTGKAFDFWCHTLLWNFLTVITLGIYAFWRPLKLMKWKARNTIFEYTNL